MINIKEIFKISAVIKYLLCINFGYYLKLFILSKFVYEIV